MSRRPVLKVVKTNYTPSAPWMAIASLFYWLGARCKGIARFAALHLDTCSLRQEEVAKISREEICRSRKRGKRLVLGTKLLRLLSKVSRLVYTPRRDSGSPVDSWAHSSTNTSARAPSRESEEFRRTRFPVR
jgi:hypothetical protein